MEMQKDRDKRIDIAKAIGIILVVLGHAGAPHSSIFFRFHMALFFFLSGWCFNDKHIITLKSFFVFIVKKLKSLYIPFILFNGGAVVLTNFLIKINIYTNDERFLNSPLRGGGNLYGLTEALSAGEIGERILNILKFRGESQLGGATWFLAVLFYLSIMWGGCSICFKKNCKI